MNNILQQIVDFKKQEVAKIRQEVTVQQLVKSPDFKRTPLSLAKSLTEKGSSGIIAEFKRQ